LVLDRRKKIVGSLLRLPPIPYAGNSVGADKGDGSRASYGTDECAAPPLLGNDVEHSISLGEQLAA